MSQKPSGVNIEVVHQDGLLLTLRVTATNCVFSGIANVFADPEKCRAVATILEGFPLTPCDTREVILGGFGPEWAGDAVSMRFFCGDGSGHAFVEVKMESLEFEAGIIQACVLVVPVEAAAIDDFVRGLRQVPNSSTVHLASRS